MYTMNTYCSSKLTLDAGRKGASLVLKSVFPCSLLPPCCSVSRLCFVGGYFTNSWTIHKCKLPSSKIYSAL